MLNQRIHKYFDQFPGLRVLFFFDPDKQYEADFENLDIEDIRKVKYDHRDFYLKTMLHGEWSTEKVFLYFQQKEPASDEEYRHFPLLSIMIANKVLYLDNVNDFIEQFQLGASNRMLANKYKRELKLKKVQDVLLPILRPGRFEETEIIKGLLSCFLKSVQIENWETILVKMLELGLQGKEADLDPFIKKVAQNNLETQIIEKVRNYFGVTIDSIDKKILEDLHNRLKYNLITSRLEEREDDRYMKEYRIKDRGILSSLLTMAENARNNPKLKADFESIVEKKDSPILESHLIEIYGANADFAYFSLLMIWEILAGGIAKIDTQPKIALQYFEQISLLNFNPEIVKRTTGFLSYVAHAIAHINSIPSYIFDTPETYIEEYVQGHYQIDQAYRIAINHFRSIDFSNIPENINLDSVKELLEKRYEKHIEKQNREWLKCLSEKGFRYDQLQVSLQHEFFRREVEPYDQKIVVIISDALRYEAAESLLNNLHTDNKNEAVIRNQLASIPSTTKFGMANLLPSKGIIMKDGELFINEISTEGLANRQNILKQYTPEATAHQFSDVEGNTQNVNREIFKSPLVYIYHNTIDAIGDNRQSERNTFIAVDNAIKELTGMVKKLHSSYNVAKVLITADHGFIYNDRTINEADKENLQDKSIIEIHNRFAITSDSLANQLGYSIELKKVSNTNSNHWVAFPHSVNRYKKQGVGQQFVHGGASLQELIVPVIESARKAVKVAQKVNPVLLSTNLKIVSNVLRIKLLQEQKVSGTHKSREIVIGIYANQELVSNKVNIQMNATAELPSERGFMAELMLQGSSSGVLRLKIFDTNDLLNPIINQEVINNTLIEPDF